MRHCLSISLLAVAALGVGSAATAATFTWTGAVSDDWSTPGNWTYGGGTDTDASGFPNSSSDLDVAIFTGTPTANQPTLSASITIDSIQFATNGWTIAGGFNLVGRSTSEGIVSSGSGVNTIAAGLRATNSSTDWDINDTSVLRLTGPVGFNRGTQKFGSGKLVLDTTVTGIGDDVQGLSVVQGLALINTSDLTASSNGNWSVSSGATLGGTGSINFGSARNLSVSGTLAPGGDGTYGTEIESLNIAVGEGTVSMNSGSKLAMQIASLLNHDTLTINRSGASGGYLDLMAGNNTLDLTGPGPLEVGTYQLVTFADQGSFDYGSFESVLYNGAALGPDAWIAYNASSIDLVVVPEPASLVLVGLGGLIMLGRGRLA